MKTLDLICSKGFFAYLYGFGAIDTWLGTNLLYSKKTNGAVFVLTNADVAELAKLFENLRFPGVDLADAALDNKNCTYYFRCVDFTSDYKPCFAFLNFYYDYSSQKFLDPSGNYMLLRGIRKNLLSDSKIGENQIDLLKILSDELNSNFVYGQSDGYLSAVTDTALVLAKYYNSTNHEIKSYLNTIASLFNAEAAQFQRTEMNQEWQRIFLSELITSSNPALGLEFLKRCGFIDKFWPELARLDDADHSKEFHPEGNGWEHTIETFRHRKITSGQSWQFFSHDLLLSLGLLLHDCGKPISSSAGSHRYDGHAELGEFQARRFLERLGFGQSLTNDVCFLVKNHMLPAALPRLPLFRTEQIMSSPLFPLLMELYRCDESSSFKGLDGYYESSAVYQQFLRNKRNPYRTADGKKLHKKQKSGVRK